MRMRAERRSTPKVTRLSHLAVNRPDVVVEGDAEEVYCSPRSSNTYSEPFQDVAEAEDVRLAYLEQAPRTLRRKLPARQGSRSLSIRRYEYLKSQLLRNLGLIT